MAEPFIGQINMYGFNFAVRSWAFCDGQLLPISQHTALFSLIGTIYGGDGRTTFSLPEMRGRVPMHAGTGPGLTPRNIGFRAGQEEVSLSLAQMPSHSHTATNQAQLYGFSGPGNSSDPVGHIISGTTSGTPYGDGTGFGTSGALHASSVVVETQIQQNGGGAEHYNMQPYQVVTFQIALDGIFPPRD